MDELGLGWEVVEEANPKIIMASVSGYGPRGAGGQAKYLAGGKLDATVFESSLSLFISVGPASLNLGKRRRLGLGHPNLALYVVYQTKHGRYMFIAASNNGQLTVFYKRIGRLEMRIDERSNTNDGRFENSEELVRLINERFSTKALSKWFGMFDGCGLQYGAISDVDEALTHPHAETRDMVDEIDDFPPTAKALPKTIATPVRFGGV